MSAQQPRRIRSEFETRIAWTIDDTRHEGHSHDLSLSGVLIETTDMPELGKEIHLEIFLPGDPDTPHIATKAVVARHDEHGFAANFKEIDTESYHHLTNLVAYQNENPDDVFKEQAAKPGIK